jgi:hypothetical protein
MRFGSISLAFIGLVAVTTVVSAPSAQAQVPLLSNLTVFPSNFGTGIDPSAQKALTFTTGASALTVTSFTGSFSLNTSTAGTGVISAALFTVTGDDPAVLVGSLGTATVTNPFVQNNPALTSQDYTFTPASAVVLNANTRYSLLIDYVSGTSVFWVGTDPNTLPTAQSGSGITNVLYRVSGNNGLSYNPSGTFNRAQLNGFVTAAPEPGSLALGLFGLVGGALAVRKRRK